jgi:hypothetical protein
MDAKDSRSSQYSPNNYPHNMPTIAPTTHTPHTPPGIAVRNSLPLALSGIAPAILPPLPLPLWGASLGLCGDGTDVTAHAMEPKREIPHTPAPCTATQNITGFYSTSVLGHTVRPIQAITV